MISWYWNRAAGLLLCRKPAAFFFQQMNAGEVRLLEQNLHLYRILDPLQSSQEWKAWFHLGARVHWRLQKDETGRV